MSKRLFLAALAATVLGAAAPAMAQKTVTIVREIDTDRYDPQKSTARSGAEVMYMIGDTLVNLDYDMKTLRPGLATVAARLVVLAFRHRLQIAEVSEPRRKGSFDRLGIGSGELVFEGKRAMRPRGEGFRVCELLKLGTQPLSKAFKGVGR